MRFENPANGYVEEVSNAPIWCLLFGCIYFAVKGVWTHAVAALVLAIFTACISWLIYPFFANQIMRTHYLRRGWIELVERGPHIGINAQRQSHTGRNILYIVLVLFAVSLASLAASVWFAGTGTKTDKTTFDEHHRAVPAPKR